MNKKDFIDKISESYQFEGQSFIIGGAMLDRECLTNSLVRVPLSTLNRHGLIAGSTGSGKTKTLQIMAEHLSESGVPCLLMDIKGDLSGLGAPSPGHKKIDERHDSIGIPFTPSRFPLEFLSLSEEKGIKLRATITEFGPILLSKILDLNDTQSSILSLIFKYCDDHDIPLLDIDDLKQSLQFAIGQGKEEISSEYGAVSSASVGAIMRKLIVLEQQGAEILFGEPSFEVEDLLATDRDGRGILNIIRLTDMQDRPNIFSTFVLQLLAEIYSTFPEEGDVEQPKLVLFIDEAHLVFKNADKALLDQIEVIVKLIRSKGVGIVFITQNPTDIPAEVLSQLGFKIQHALRAFTAKDRKAIKQAAENFPISDFYETSELLTELGTGEALITVLNEDGIPTPLVHTLLRAPQSRMDVLSEKEIETIFKSSQLVSKYQKEVNRDSAFEILMDKIEKAKTEEIKELREKEKRKSKKVKSTLDKVLNSTTTRQIGRTVARELTRGLLGVLGIGGKSRKKGLFF